MTRVVSTSCSAGGVASSGGLNISGTHGADGWTTMSSSSFPSSATSAIDGKGRFERESK